MTFLLAIHSVITVLAALLLGHFVSPLAGKSVLAGGAVSLLNLVALVVAWPLILRKKLFALSISIIVIKFAILGWILYAVVSATLHQKLWHLGWFSVGLGLVVFSVVATAFQSTRTSLTKADA